MKTNREVFTEKLINASTEEFAKLTSCYGKCGRCSNNFWDGNQISCHKNINNSTCEKGYAEWLEAKAGEDLQEKYDKEYCCFRDYTSAQFARKLMDILYTTGAVGTPYEEGEDRCRHCFTGTVCSDTSCYMYWQHIMNLYYKYVERQAREKAKGYEDKVRLYIDDICEKFHVKDYIIQMLIPKIQDERIKGRAEMLMELKLQYDDKFDSKEKKK